MECGNIFNAKDAKWQRRKENKKRIFKKSQFLMQRYARMELSFYLDTHISKQVAIQLRNKGIDVVRCEDIDLEEAEDLQHLTVASEQKRVLVTKDDDFIKLHGKWQANNLKHYGIFFCIYRDRPAIGEIVKFCEDMNELIKGDAADIQQDIENQVYYIT